MQRAETARPAYRAKQFARAFGLPHYLRGTEMRRAIVCATVLMMLGCGEQRRYEYQTPEAVADAVRRGWVPPCIPPSSALETEQNVDTNESWGIATFSDADEQSLRQHIVEWSGPKPALRRPSALPSWPDYLVEAGTSTVTQLHRCVNGDAFLLSVDWNGNRVFFARSTP